MEKEEKVEKVERNQFEGGDGGEGEIEWFFRFFIKISFYLFILEVL